MSEEQTNGEQKTDLEKKKHRSPNYPYIGLKDALVRAKELVSTAGAVAPIRITTARDVWKYQKGTGNQVVAALDAYKLITVSGVAEDRLLRITTEARKILDDTSDSPDLLKQSALAPPIHQEVWNYYNGELPPDNRVLREYLVYSKGFNPAYVEKFIEQFRETLAFAKITSSDKIKVEGKTPIDSSGGHNNVQAGQQTGQQTGQHSPPPPRRPGMQILPATFDVPEVEDDVLTFNISRTGKAQVRFNGQITQEGIQKLVALLNLSVDTYPTQAELVQPKAAIWRNKDSDQPVAVTGSAGVHEGKEYLTIEGSDTGVPADEVEFEE